MRTARKLAWSLSHCKSDAKVSSALANAKSKQKKAETALAVSNPCGNFYRPLDFDRGDNTLFAGMTSQLSIMNCAHCFACFFYMLGIKLKVGCLLALCK